MTSPRASRIAPFGRVLTAMVTPFTAEGDVDLAGVQKVATYLVDQGNDGLIVSGTTGESPTTTVEEDGSILSAVIEAVGDRASIVAGVGTNDTRHSVQLARQAKRAGADGLLIVSPYYSKPPQSGIIAHVNTVAAAGDDVPVMLYDIPGRTGVQFSPESYAELVKNPLVVATKDAVGDLTRGSWLMRETGIIFYSGDDAMNFAWLTHGAAGVVSVVGHAASRQHFALVEAVDAGNIAAARDIHNSLLPAVKAMMTHTQGAITAKVALQLLGVLDNRTMRSPLPEATDEEVAIVRDGLVASGLLES